MLFMEASQYSLAVIVRLIGQEDFEVSIFLTELSTPHSILTRHKHFAEKQTRLVGSKEAPMEIADDGEPPMLREESDEDVKANMEDIPSIDEPSGYGTANDAIRIEEDGLDAANSGTSPDLNCDEKKKMGLNTIYDGFQIYGRILCLVVKRKDGSRGKQSGGGGGQAMVEEWISSTQANENRWHDS